jgi:cyanuric acid amidohydrolase
LAANDRETGTVHVDVWRFGMAHPGDLSALQAAIADGRVAAAEIVAIIGKTEGNGGVNDFTRGYFTLALTHLLAGHLAEDAAAIARRLPVILSGGTEGVLSPHYTVFTRRPGPPAAAGDKRLAIGIAMVPALPPEAIGRQAQIDAVEAAVHAAMRDAGITDPADVRFVQVKAGCLTGARQAAAAARGKTTATPDSGRSMALSRVAGAFGVARALGEAPAERLGEAQLLVDFGVTSAVASVSSGVEVEGVEVVVLGNVAHAGGPFRISSRPMADALDLPAVTQVLADLGLAAAPQLSPGDQGRVAAMLVKCEPARSGRIRGHRHTMLDDTDINAQRHIRGAVGAICAAVIGDGRIFVSGGAENQGPDGGGLVAVIAAA